MIYKLSLYGEVSRGTYSSLAEEIRKEGIIGNKIEPVLCSVCGNQFSSLHAITEHENELYCDDCLSALEHEQEQETKDMKETYESLKKL